MTSLDRVALDTTQFGPPGARVTYANLCETGLDLGVHDWAMSFEVGEHLPDSCLASYVRLLDASNRMGVLLAWSSHTAGQCHVNPRHSSQVVCLYELLGYELDVWHTLHGRHRAFLSWFRHDYIVMRRRTRAMPGFKASS